MQVFALPASESGQEKPRRSWAGTYLRGEPRRIISIRSIPYMSLSRTPKGPKRRASANLSVRPEGAFHQWRRNPPRKLSIGLVADERPSWATGGAEAS